MITMIARVEIDDPGQPPERLGARSSAWSTACRQGFLQEPGRRSMQGKPTRYAGSKQAVRQAEEALVRAILGLKKIRYRVGAMPPIPAKRLRAPKFGHFAPLPMPLCRAGRASRNHKRAPLRGTVEAVWYPNVVPAAAKERNRCI